MKKRYYIYFFCITLFLGQISCSTQKKTASSSSVEKESLVKLNYQQQEISSANLSNVNVSFNYNGNAISSRASLKLLRDSIIQISVQPILGVELGRVTITPTKVVAINKLQGRYFEANINQFLKQVDTQGVFSQLQSLLLNELFIAGNVEKDPEKLINQFKISRFPEGYFLQSQNNIQDLKTEHVINYDNRISMTMLSYKGATLTCSFKQHSLFKNKTYYPTQIILSFAYGKQNETVILDIKNATFNQPFVVNSINTDHYRKVTNLEDLFKK